MMSMVLLCFSAVGQQTQEEIAYTNIARDAIIKLDIQTPIKTVVFVLPNIEYGAPAIVMSQRVDGHIASMIMLSKLFLDEYPNPQHHRALIAHEVGHLHQDCFLPTDPQQQICADWKGADVVGKEIMLEFLDKTMRMFPYDMLLPIRLLTLMERDE
jgi:hypothetical protein